MLLINDLMFRDLLRGIFIFFMVVIYGTRTSQQEMECLCFGTLESFACAMFDC